MVHRLAGSWWISKYQFLYAFALPRTTATFLRATFSVDFQRVGGHLRPEDPCPYLGKCNVAGGRAIIREWRKAAIVRGSELFNRNVSCRLQYAISYKFGRLDSRI